MHRWFRFHNELLDVQCVIKTSVSHILLPYVSRTRSNVSRCLCFSEAVRTREDTLGIHLAAIRSLVVNPSSTPTLFLHRASGSSEVRGLFLVVGIHIKVETLLQTLHSFHLFLLWTAFRLHRSVLSSVRVSTFPHQLVAFLFSSLHTMVAFLRSSNLRIMLRFLRINNLLSLRDSSSLLDSSLPCFRRISSVVVPMGVDDHIVRRLVDIQTNVIVEVVCRRRLHLTTIIVAAHRSVVEARHLVAVVTPIRTCNRSKTCLPCRHVAHRFLRDQCGNRICFLFVFILMASRCP